MPQGGNSNNTNFKKGFKSNANRFNKSPNNRSNIKVDETNPTVIAFRAYASELDDKHDRHERLVKLGRDVTIESKRIIFLLHTIDGRKDNYEKVLKEAEERLQKLIDCNIKAMAKELRGQDPYQYRNAYSPGLQEFIEAYTFMEYFRHSKGSDQTHQEAEHSSEPKGLSDWELLQEKMQYKDEDEKAQEQATEATEEQLDSPVDKPSLSSTYQFFVDPNEYILGLSDLTGELMRRCINSLGCGETEVCLETCKVLQQFFTGYISLNVQRCRELSRKIYTMRQSTLKAENVCYNVKVRGGEAAAKWGSTMEVKPSEEVDEGFF